MKAALSQYEVDIQMTPATLEALMASGYALSAFKAVQTTVNGAAPLLWYQTSRLLMTTSIIWQEQYQAYASTSQIIAHGMIRPNSTTDIGLGQTAQVGANGAMTATDGGTPAAISILNQASQPWTCGVSQVVENQANPVCAVPLYGNMLDVIAPVEQVLLMLSAMSVNTGTVIYQAYAPGVLIDLRGAAQRTVQFDINNGWSWDSGTWARSVASNTDLVPLLIQQ